MAASSTVPAMPVERTVLLPVCARARVRCVGASAPGGPPPFELAHHPQQLPQQPAQRTPTADGAREEVCGGAVVLVLCKLSQHVVTLLAWNVLTRRRRTVGAAD